MTQRMSDTLQLVVTRPTLKLPETAQPNVRYASACRRGAVISSEEERLNECPIRFSLS